MRYDADHKERTRALLLREAARAIRAQGARGVGVATIMGKAGLTHGGFYAHFKSKDELIAEAMTAMFADILGKIDEYTRQRTPAEALAGYIDFYLSQRHRDDRARGCPIPALCGEAPHLAGAARRAFGAGIEAVSARLAGLLEATGQARPRQAAASLLAELAGALAMARAMPGSAESEFLLATSREALHRRFGLSATG
ncbi:TetR/AcrR family transcriptional regulator [Solimonas sp. K1W22B-7]|uniref:TetR/AcrR family transcriptional regulator n=1 Tax=Solimonas sp. K1W22B-7 TaxID=2303331 RepID=UPI000E333B82|nr:TetR/AcrR family transcriptional regulator [Solimonas sp. K1W22B-7]AXQ28420.1 TetR/AcrR family transcriptional regulator [Solimonas sp. K1W22B-7]